MVNLERFPNDLHVCEKVSVQVWWWPGDEGQEGAGEAPPFSCFWEVGWCWMDFGRTWRITMKFLAALPAYGFWVSGLPDAEVSFLVYHGVRTLVLSTLGKERIDYCQLTRSRYPWGCWCCALDLSRFFMLQISQTFGHLSKKLITLTSECDLSILQQLILWHLKMLISNQESFWDYLVTTRSCVNCRLVARWLPDPPPPLPHVAARRGRNAVGKAQSFPGNHVMKTQLEDKLKVNLEWLKSSGKNWIQKISGQKPWLRCGYDSTVTWGPDSSTGEESAAHHCASVRGRGAKGWRRHINTSAKIVDTPQKWWFPFQESPYEVFFVHFFG